MKDMRVITSCTLVALVMLSCTNDVLASIDENEREILLPNFPYGRPMPNNDVQLAKIFLLPQRSCASKRNSELINSLLGLPKNMNNAGRK